MARSLGWVPVIPTRGRLVRTCYNWAASVENLLATTSIARQVHVLISRVIIIVQCKRPLLYVCEPFDLLFSTVSTLLDSFGDDQPAEP